MESNDLHVLSACCHRAAENRRFALVTIAKTRGCAPRPPGSWLAFRDDGLVEGSISGGRIEYDLIARMREKSAERIDNQCPVYAGLRRYQGESDALRPALRRNLGAGGQTCAGLTAA